MSSQNSDLPEGFKITELGPLPQEWETARLGELFEIKQGKALSPEHRRGISPGLFLRTANVFWGRLDLANVDNMDFTDNEVSQLRLMPNDLLVCEGGDIGRTAIWRGQLDVCCYQNHLHRLRAIRDTVYPLYYMYWMQAAHLLLGLYEGTGNKTTIPNLSQSRLKSFILPVPPLPEQKAIARVLSTIQKAVETQDKVIAAAKELRKSLMRHLFNYGPVPVSEADKIPLKDTEIGAVPEHWEVVKIRDVAEFQGGYAFKSGNYVKEGVKLLKIANVSFGKVVWDDVSFLPDEYMENYEDYSLHRGEIIMAMTRPIVAGGIKVARLEEKDCPSLLNQRVGRFRIGNSINAEYLFQILFNKSFVDAIGLGAIGSQQPNISASQIESIIIPLPSLSVQLEIADMLSAVDSKIESEENRKAALQTLFKTMLHHLMTGKVRVKELEAQLL